MKTVIGVSKLGIMVFWLLAIYAFAGGDIGWLTTPIKWISLITLDIHIIEALWFLWWKGSDDVPLLPNIAQIFLFGGFHIMPLYKAFNIKHKGEE